MCKDNEQEVRQRWRETDGFAKAGEAVGKDFHERMKESVVMGKAEDPLVRFHNTLSVMHHSPLFIMTAISICINPESAGAMYSNFVAANLKPQLAIFQELIEAGILERVNMGVRVCGHEALRMYVDALTNVRLPQRRWVMP